MVYYICLCAVGREYEKSCDVTKYCKKGQKKAARFYADARAARQRKIFSFHRLGMLLSAAGEV